MPALTVTRVVHATVLLDFDGHVILTDPWFSEKRGYHPGEPRGLEVGTLPHLTGVVVSHGHYDHYDMDAFRAYPHKDVPMVVKRGTGEKARNAGFVNVIEVDPWETVSLGPITVTAAPAKHAVRENTYVLQMDGSTVYFGADTLLIPELREIAPRFPTIDLALLSINGLTIRPALNRKVVMGPEDAAELCSILRPRVVVPIHYAFTGGPIADRFLLKYAGTADEVLATLRRALTERAPDTELQVLAPGQPLTLEGNSAGGQPP